MKRLSFYLWFSILLLALSGCGLLPGRDAPAGETLPLSDVLVGEKPVDPPASATHTASPPTATTSPTSTNTAVPPTATAPPPATPTNTPADLALFPAGISLFPVPELYEGDTVTVQVAAFVPEGINPSEVQVQLLVDQNPLANGTLNGRNLGGDAVALFAWVWDTSSAAGDRQLTVVLDPNDVIVLGDENPENNRVDLTISIQPATALPAGQQDATWITTETQYAHIHVVSGTAAARDLAFLEEATDLAAEQAITMLQEQPERKFDVYFIDRVLGQGGYAGSSMVVSYLDRDYAGGGLHEVLVHEMVHLLDQQFTHHRIPFLVEGIAVWATGGHYKQENLDHRMAVLREMGLYVPIADLMDDFYPTQHEIGYLEGAGFIKYLVDSFGWPAVREFYAGINPDDALSTSTLVDQALQRNFNKSLAELEAEWTAFLDRTPYNSDAEIDLRTTLRYYDTMRRYQLLYDPTAHFLQAWLPFPQELESRNITADLTRHPETELNIALETMLQSVNNALLIGNYNRANVLLDSVERVLASDGVFADPIASHHLDIVRSLSSLGYQVQAIEVIGNQAVVQAQTSTGSALTEINLELRNRGWVVTN